MTPRRRSALALLLVAVPLVGCASDVTSARLEPSLSSTFTRLLMLQQQETGLLVSTPAESDAHASCYRGGSNRLRSGAGDDLQCLVSYSTSSGPSMARFDVQAQATGCWKADGTPFDVGAATVTDDTTGRTVTNPLLEFDGCFDTSIGAG